MFILFSLAMMITPIHAYLDPGTGSMLVSTIIALMATLIYSLKSFAFNIKSSIAKIFGKKIKKISNVGLVFYNEGDQYFTTFYPVLKELQNRGIEFTYLYSDRNDTIIKEIDGINAHYIDEGNKAFFHLNTLQAKMCIMTTPGLDVLQIKRSKGVAHYCHLAHSASGCRYQVFGVDYFDSVLLPNRFDKKFIEKLEEKRGLPKKDIRIVGIPYLDYAYEQIEKMTIIKPEKETILLSPTWGEHGLLNKYGLDLLSVLLFSGKYDVIIRPHPQSVRYETEMLDEIKHKFQNNQNLYWDYKNDGLESMSKSSIMISDFSGIIMDYIFLFAKQVISFPGTIDLRGRDYVDKDDTLWYIDFYNKFTTVLKAENIENVNNVIDGLLKSKVLQNNKQYEGYNPYARNSAKRIVDVIEDIYKNIEKGNR